MGVYLDNAATSFPKPDVVISAMTRYMHDIGASPGRGTYRAALAAEQLLHETRSCLARLFHIEDPARIVFTSSVTESINLAIKGIVTPGCHVVTTSMEHNAVWRCLRGLEVEGLITVTVVPCDRAGRLEPELLSQAICPETRLIVMTHASNVTGTILPAASVGAIARRCSIPFLLDTAQTAGSCPVDVRDLNVDLLAFTGHKGLLGPPGTGGLYIREGIVLRPLKDGGTGTESRLDVQPESLPQRYEAGTPNTVGIAGLGAAVKWLIDESVEAICSREQELVQLALKGLADIPGLTIHGPNEPESQVAVISFTLENTRPEEVAYALDEVYDIIVRAGLHCSPCGHRTIGTDHSGTVRVSFSPLTTAADVEELIDALADISDRL